MILCIDDEATGLIVRKLLLQSQGGQTAGTLKLRILNG